MSLSLDNRALDEGVWTLQDALEYLEVYTQSGGAARSLREYRAAAISALADLRNIHQNWNHYWQEHRIYFDAPVTAGTITYDHTDGFMGERQLTFSVTPPAWAGFGRIVIDNEIYAISSVSSDIDVFFMDPSLNPGEDIVEPTEFVLYRSEYPLPADMWSYDMPMIEQDALRLGYIPPSEWMLRERWNRSSGDPFYFTVLPDDNRQGAYKLVVDGYPSERKSLGFMYRRGVSPMRYTGEETSSHGTTTETARGALELPLEVIVLTDKMTGAVLRISADSTAPTGFLGDNPFLEQHLIREIAAENTASLSTPLEYNTTGGNAVTVTSLIDIAPTMLEAYKAGLRRHYALLTRDAADQRRATEEYYAAVRCAKEMESQLQTSGASSANLPWTYRVFDRHTGMVTEE